MSHPKRRREVVGGYPLEGFCDVDQIKQRDLLCSICVSVIRTATGTTCGHVFCKECINAWDGNCPQCRNNEFDIHPCLYLDRQISQLRVKCDFCDWIGPLLERTKHQEETCLGKCPTCKTQIHVRHLEAHGDQCPQRLLPCPRCGTVMPQSELLTFHEAQHVPVVCTGCETSMETRELPRHLQRACPKTIVTCPYAVLGCEAKFPAEQWESHMQQKTLDHADHVVAMAAAYRPVIPNAVIDMVRCRYSVAQIRTALVEANQITRRLQVTVTPPRNADTALHWSCIRGDPELIDLLLEYGANLEARNAQGNTPFLEAGLGRWVTFDVSCLIASMIHLLKRGANIHAKNDEDMGLAEFPAAAVTAIAAYLESVSPQPPTQLPQH